jgi:antitoxin component of RelBE/YafQ-DinJ toxin-antitoxin module
MSKKKFVAFFYVVRDGWIRLEIKATVYDVAVEELKQKAMQGNFQHIDSMILFEVINETEMPVEGWYKEMRKQSLLKQLEELDQT